MQQTSFVQGPTKRRQRPDLRIPAKNGHKVKFENRAPSASARCRALRRGRRLRRTLAFRRSSWLLAPSAPPSAPRPAEQRSCPPAAMRTRGTEGSPLRTPQLWEFWERGGKSPAASAARSPAAAPLPAAPCACPASAAGDKAAAAPPAEEAAAAASSVLSAGASDGSPAHRRAASRAVFLRPPDNRASRTQSAQAPPAVGVAQSQVGGGASGVSPGAHALRDDFDRRGAAANGVQPERCAVRSLVRAFRARAQASAPQCKPDRPRRRKRRPRRRSRPSCSKSQRRCFASPCDSSVPAAGALRRACRGTWAR